MTTCEMEPWYGCYTEAECGNFGDAGGCGWKLTDKLEGCITESGGAP